MRYGIGSSSFKLTDLLAMIFDKKLFAHPTDDPDNENFIERLVRHEFDNVANDSQYAIHLQGSAA